MTSKLDFLKKYMGNAKLKDKEAKKRELKLLTKCQNLISIEESTANRQTTNKFVDMDSPESEDDRPQVVRQSSS